MSDRATLKTFFETGDFPTEGQYADFIDSAPNIEDDYNDEPAFSRLADVAISSAQILALNSSPVILVAAPGAGFTIMPETVLVQYIFVTTSYTGDITPVVIVDTANASAFQFFSLLADTVTTIKKLTPVTPFGSDIDQFPEDKALRITTGASNPLTGDSTIRVFVTYTIIPV